MTLTFDLLTTKKLVQYVTRATCPRVLGLLASFSLLELEAGMEKNRQTDKQTERRTGAIRNAPSKGMEWMHPTVSHMVSAR